MRRVSSLSVCLWLFSQIVFFAAGASGSGPPAEEQEGEVVCFVYHRFGDDRYPSTNIPVEAFRSHLEFLKAEAYTVYTLGEAVRRLRSGAGVPERTVVLTVDDGYTSFFENAMPLLRAFGFKATLFINSANVGGGGYMGWEELRKVADEGIEIGNHSHSHAYFLNLEDGAARFRADVRTAQAEIEARLGVAPGVFSYPFGEYTLEMKRVVQEMGFDAAVAQNSGVMYAGSDFYALPRFPMGGLYTAPDGFMSKARMKALKVRASFPESPLLRGENPPALTLRLDLSDLDVNGLRCFVRGEEACSIRHDPEDSSRVRVRADRALNQRRTLYTITVPSPDRQVWYWFSHLWVQPGISE